VRRSAGESCGAAVLAHGPVHSHTLEHVLGTNVGDDDTAGSPPTAADPDLAQGGSLGAVGRAVGGPLPILGRS